MNGVRPGQTITAFPYGSTFLLESDATESGLNATVYQYNSAEEEFRPMVNLSRSIDMIVDLDMFPTCNNEEAP